jgi:hypothetical protein
MQDTWYASKENIGQVAHHVTFIWKMNGGSLAKWLIAANSIQTNL